MVNSTSSIVFTVALSPGDNGTNALLLAESIRNFAGRLSDSPIRLYITQNTVLPHLVEERLRALDVEFVNYEVNEDSAKFFFLPEVIAAAQAEERTEGESETLVWLGANTLVLHEPRDLLLPAGKSIGYRPVHHTNVGSPIDAPIDDFWSLIYERCGVARDRIFPMKTHVDGNTLRPYFNAGHLAVRPGKRLLRKWSQTFLELYVLPEFQFFYADGRYRIFMHQAVLSGVILAEFSRGELYELPPTYNYPIHLHVEDATCGKPTSIEEMVTVRHEGFWEEHDWEKRMPARKSLKKWIKDRLPKT